MERRTWARAWRGITLSVGLLGFLVAQGLGHTAHASASLPPLPPLTCDLESYPSIDCIADPSYAALLVHRENDTEAPSSVAFAPPAFTGWERTRSVGSTPSRPSSEPRDLLHIIDAHMSAPASGTTLASVDASAAITRKWTLPKPLVMCPRRDVSAQPQLFIPRPIPLEPSLAEPRAPREQSAQLAVAPPVRQVIHRVRPGETMSAVLGSVGVAPKEVDEWLRATRRVYNLNRIYVGQALSFSIEEQSSALVQLSLEIDPRTRLVGRRTPNGVLVAEEPIPHTRRLRIVGGDITRTLYAAALDLNIPEQVISDMAEILGWEINFTTDLRIGASFRVVYEELVRVDTGDTTPGRVLAVEVTNRGRTHEGFYFVGANGAQRGYYDRAGASIGRAFQRYPVSYARVSSHFSRARYHPLLKRRRPHYGVDFAARPGTPVEAVADGRVTKAGWSGGYGRFVKIQHDAVYGSGYAHLVRIARGIKPGAVVTKGQVIGYVGSSGLATGPHLHFELYRHGKYIDPLNADLPRGRTLDGDVLHTFQSAVEQLAHTYAEVATEYARFQQVEDTTPHLVAAVAN